MADVSYGYVKIPTDNAKNWQDAARYLLITGKNQEVNSCGYAPDKVDEQLVNKKAAELKAANGNEEKPEDAMWSITEWFKFDSGQYEAVKVPITFCTVDIKASTQVATTEPIKTIDLQNIANVEQGKTASYASNIAVAEGDVIELSPSSCDHPKVSVTYKIVSGKLVIDVKAEANARVGSLPIEILIKGNDGIVKGVYTATVTVTKRAPGQTHHEQNQSGKLPGQGLETEPLNTGTEVKVQVQPSTDPCAGKVGTDLEKCQAGEL